MFSSWCNSVRRKKKTFIVPVTNLVEYDTTIIEPVAGNAGTHTLCPGLV